MINKGGLIISLDFELGWGLQDINRDGSYDSNLYEVHNVVPRLLNLFNKYDVHVTWATVGMLCASSKEILKDYLPKLRPDYQNKEFSSYEILNEIENEDERYFGSKLVNLVKNSPNQEIGTHTFSHYYCVEEGQNGDQFLADLSAAKKIVNEPIQSIVFPRNQINKSYLKICKQQGITAYRGNPKHRLFKTEQFSDGWHYKRICKIADSYFNLTGHHTFRLDRIEKKQIWNIQASAFLRPFYSHLKMLENLKFKRIAKSLRYAAKNKEFYHLWWHPHNFGKNLDENFNTLEKILIEFSTIRKKYDFQSYSMNEVVELLEERSEH